MLLVVDDEEASRQGLHERSWFVVRATAGQFITSDYPVYGIAGPTHSTSAYWPPARSATGGPRDGPGLDTGAQPRRHTSLGSARW